MLHDQIIRKTTSKEKLGLERISFLVLLFSSYPGFYITWKMEYAVCPEKSSAIDHHGEGKIPKGNEGLLSYS